AEDRGQPRPRRPGRAHGRLQGRDRAAQGRARAAEPAAHRRPLASAVARTADVVHALGMLLRIVLGIIKGAAIGGGIGYGASQLGLGSGWNFMIYGAVGLMVGLFVGR